MARRTYKIGVMKLHPKYKYAISKKTHIYYNKLNALKKATTLLKKPNIIISFFPTPVYKGKVISIRKALSLEKNK